MNSKFIVLSGPAGVGKDSIRRILVNKIDGVYSVSMTTREKRVGEVDKKDYFFVDRKIFENNIKNNNFLEYSLYNGNYYGTLKDFVFDNLKKDIDVVAILNVEGALNIKRAYPNAILVFIMPPSFNDLKRRLLSRGTDSEDIIEKRLCIAKKEITYSDKYDYCVANIDLEKTVNEIIDIIEKER